MRLVSNKPFGWVLYALMYVWTIPIWPFAYLNRKKYVGTVEVAGWRFKVYNYRWWPWPKYSIFAWPFCLHDGFWLSEDLVEHEALGHGVQQMIFGPLFLPLYVLAMVAGYRNNVFEIWARAMEPKKRGLVWIDGPLNVTGYTKDV